MSQGFGCKIWCARSCWFWLSKGLTYLEATFDKAKWGALGNHRYHVLPVRSLGRRWSKHVNASDLTVTMMKTIKIRSWHKRGLWIMVPESEYLSWLTHTSSVWDSPERKCKCKFRLIQRCQLPMQSKQDVRSADQWVVLPWWWWCWSDAGPMC